MLPNLLKNLIRALVRQGYLWTGRRIERAYSYAAINALKVSGLAMMYQPMYHVSMGRVLGKTAPERACEDRWALIGANVPEGPGSFLDLGSQLGYFSFRLAERGYFGIGVERDWASSSLARHVGRINGLDSAHFHCAEISPETIAAMPTVDVTLCLSIFHHWVREHGLEYATGIMRLVAERNRSQLFFETGQSNEPSGRWPELLSFMGEDPKTWIADYLASLDFDEVRCLGEVPTHVSGTPRFLFAASRRAGAAGEVPAA